MNQFANLSWSPEMMALTAELSAPIVPHRYYIYRHCQSEDVLCYNRASAIRLSRLIDLYERFHSGEYSITQMFDQVRGVKGYHRSVVYYSLDYLVQFGYVLAREYGHGCGKLYTFIVPPEKWNFNREME